MVNTGDTRTLLTIQEAAETLCVSVSTLRRWDRAGTLKAFRPSERLMRYRRADLDAFIARETADR